MQTALDMTGIIALSAITLLMMVCVAWLCVLMFQQMAKTRSKTKAAEKLSILKVRVEKGKFGFVAQIDSDFGNDNANAGFGADESEAVLRLMRTLGYVVWVNNGYWEINR